MPADSAKRQVRLLVAGQQAGREAVAPFDLAEEGLAVLGVADRARRDEQRALGAEALELAPVVGETVADARDRQGQELVPGIDSLAEPGDRRPAGNLVDAPVDDVCDEQAGGVRTQIDGGYAHQSSQGNSGYNSGTPRGGAVR